MQQTLTFNLSAEQEKEFFKHLKKLGNVKENTNEHVLWNVKGLDWNSIMYKSGKLVVQSADKIFLDEIRNMFSKNSPFEPHIGSDEVGKGDYFGPLVVCACYVGESNIEKIKDLGIVDSKNLNDGKIVEIAEILVKELEYEVEIILPQKYDDLISEFNNIAIVLAKTHISLIEKLSNRVKDAQFAVVDQFSKNKSRLENESNLKIPLKQFHHAESDIVVAAASIIARYSFLQEFEKMEKSYGMKFPLGCTHVIDFAKDFVKKYGAEELDNVAKVSFRTTKQVLTLF